MTKQAFNPFLPLNEYVPDGEPHVFGDRVYLYGSHEEAGADTFCNLDYVVYSAPVTDLKDWRYEGVSYRAEQDPLYGEELKYMYAPDVVQGNDGKYYLYYCMAGYRGQGGYGQPISVAMSVNPAGPFEYLGYVKNPDGSVFRKFVSFDPAVINDNGIIRLYYGTWAPLDEYVNDERWEKIKLFAAKTFNKSVEEIESDPDNIVGACTVALSDDMLTVSGDAVKILSSRTKGTPYYDHAFFEGSSIRKIGDTYYFVYSSIMNAELCYATSKYPDRGFEYRGTIISAGDVGLNGRKDEDRLNFTGTTHGGIEFINGKWYVFYHRLTHKSGYSRQACAEEIKILSDGSIPQVEVTSCGLNGGPLEGEGVYPAVIACNITNGRMEHLGNGICESQLPNIKYSGGKNIIAYIDDGTLIGYKYFNFKGKTELSLRIKGDAEGILDIFTNETKQDNIKLSPSADWHKLKTIINCTKSAALYFKYKGKGSFNLLSFEFTPLK